MFVEWIRAMDRIAALRDRWVALESEVQNRTLYSRYDYVIPWYRAYAGTRFSEYGEPLVGLAWEGPDLVAVAPLITSRATFARVPVQRADCAGHNLAAGELLVRDGVTGAIEKFVDSLRDDLGLDLVAINGLDVASQTYERLQSHASARGAHSAYLDYHWYAIADLKDGYEAYRRARGSNFKNQTRKIAKKVAAAGAVRVDRVTSTRSEPDFSQAMRERMFCLADRSWRVSRTTPGEEREHQSFYRELFSTWGEQDALDLAILSIDGRDAAFSFALIERGIYYHTLIAFDDELRPLSPGTHLLQEVFKILPEHGIHTVLSHGSYEYKKRWASKVVPQYTICIFGRSLRAALSYFVGFKLVHRRRSRGSDAEAS
jgi:CelD/BcsL family acetyltransferase involved in cellulose biosynthesis